MFLDLRGIQADAPSGTSVAVLSIADAAPEAGGAERLAKALTRESRARRDSSKRSPCYVFLPNERYVAIEVSVHNVLTGNTEVIAVPWNSAL